MFIIVGKNDLPLFETSLDSIFFTKELKKYIYIYIYIRKKWYRYIINKHNTLFWITFFIRYCGRKNANHKRNAKQKKLIYLNFKPILFF